MGFRVILVEDSMSLGALYTEYLCSEGADDASCFRTKGPHQCFFQLAPAAVLQPGQVVVLASSSSPAAWGTRYPGVKVDGYYSGNLANGGERLAILDAAGRTVMSVNYDDEAGWPAAAPEAADG